MKRVSSFSIPLFAVLTLLAVQSMGIAVTPSLAGTSSERPRTATVADPVDLNSATLKELRSLPGIGSVYSKKILESRPYESVEELKTRKVLPAGTYLMIRDLVVAGPMKRESGRASSADVARASASVTTE